MAEDPQKPAEEVVVVAETEAKTEPDKPISETEPEKPSDDKKPDESEAAEKPAAEEVVEVEKPKITQSVSFKEESNVVGELPEAQKKALDELKHLIQDALNKHEFNAPPPPPVKEEEKKAPEELKAEEAVTAEVKKEEEAAEEEKPAPVAEEVKVEEKIEADPSKEADVVEEPPKAESETVKEEKKEEEKPTPEAETVVVAEVVEKVSTAEADGTKTVEAIKETVVSVSEEAAPSTEAAAPEELKAEEATPPPPPPEEVSIWEIPLLADERSDVVLLKFLRARDFKVKEAFTMLKNTVRWRKEFGIDALVEEDLGTDWDKVVFSHGYDKEGHPVCYNVFGEFENKELYQNTFSDEEKRQKFIKWRIQFLEKSVRKFDYSPTGICTIVQVNDLKNSPGLGKRELRQATNQALQLLQDNYPEFVAKQVRL